MRATIPWFLNIFDLRIGFLGSKNIIYGHRYPFLQVQVQKNSGCERFSAENDNANLVKSDMDISIWIGLPFFPFPKIVLKIVLWVRENVDGDIWGE